LQNGKHIPLDAAATKSPTLARKRVLVTGAGGFIGSHLVERLVSDGAQVRALLRYNSRGDRGLLELLPPEVLQEVELFWGDLRDANSVRKAIRRIEGVFHLGALIGIPYSYHAPDAYVATNVGGTLNLLEASLDQSIEFLVHTSTSEVYGTAQRVPMDETHPLQAQSPYAATKIAADQLAQSFHLSYGLPVATIRPFNAFGPRQSPRAVIPSIVNQALQGGNINLGSVDPVRDFTYVEDTVNAFVLAATVKGAIGQVINVGTGRGTSIGELAATVLHLSNNDAKVVLDQRRLRPERSEVRRLICDASKAKTVLGWEPTYTLEEGLAEVIQFIGTRTERFRKGVYEV
jgi:dTDP-glucose 4,6-dehydratase